MKHYYLIIGFLISSLYNNAQTLTLSELHKIVKYNASDFEDYVTGKGFKFLETNTEQGCTWYDFSYSRNSNDNKAFSFIDLAICSNFAKVHHQFSNEKHYLQLKTEAKNLGYTYLETRSQDNTIISEYESSHFRLLLTSKQSSSGSTIYGVTIRQK